MQSTGTLCGWRRLEQYLSLTALSVSSMTAPMQRRGEWLQRDQLAVSTAGDLRQARKELERPTFVLTADVSRAHRLGKIRECDWGYPACKIEAVCACLGQRSRYFWDCQRCRNEALLTTCCGLPEVLRGQKLLQSLCSSCLRLDFLLHVA